MENSGEVDESRNTIKATKVDKTTNVNLNINGVNHRAVVDASIERTMEKVMRQYKELNTSRSKSHSKPC